MTKVEKSKILQGILDRTVKIKEFLPAKYGVLIPGSRQIKPLFLIDGFGVDARKFFSRVMNDESVQITLQTTTNQQ